MQRRDGLLIVTEKLIDKGRQVTAKEMASFSAMSLRAMQKELQQLMAEKWIKKDGVQSISCPPKATGNSPGSPGSLGKIRTRR